MIAHAVIYVRPKPPRNVHSWILVKAKPLFFFAEVLCAFRDFLDNADYIAAAQTPCVPTLGGTYNTMLTTKVD